MPALVNRETLQSCLKQYFGQLPDPRVERTRAHQLLDIIAIALFAVLSGADSWVAAVHSGSRVGRDSASRQAIGKLDPGRGQECPLFLQFIGFTPFSPIFCVLVQDVSLPICHACGVVHRAPCRPEPLWDVESTLCGLMN